MKSSEQAVFRFGHFVLVPSERLLLCDGKPLALTGKAFDLLVTLVRAHEWIRMQISRNKLALPMAVFSCFLSLQGCTDTTAVAECAPAVATPAATSMAIASILDGIKAKHQLSSIILGVEQDGKPLYRIAIGESARGVPATTDMHFRIGGVGWQLLSTVLLRAIEKDSTRLALTDRVSTWYPDYPHADLATVRMLAASSAGFGDYIDTNEFIAQVVTNPLRVWTADDLMAFSVSPYRKPQFDNPGQDWRYSHTDFVVLGAILEKVSGKPYAALVQELVLDPLGLGNTRLQLDASPQLPVLHTLQEGDFQDSTYWNPSFVSWAALTSNVCDLGKWNRSFGTGSLLSPAMRSEVVAPVNIGLGGNTAQRYFGLGALVYPPWIVARAAYWGMYTTTAFDQSTGLSLVATIALSPGTPPGVQPSDEIITEISKLLTPDHPVPR